MELYFDKPLTARVFGRYQERNGRYELVDTYISARQGERLDTQLIRWISFETFRKFASGVGRHLVGDLTAGSSSLSKLVVPPEDRSKREPIGARRRGRGFAKFDAPASYRKGDEFYEEFAAFYKKVSAMSSRPGDDISEQSDIPIGTVRTWIRICQEKGYLPKQRVLRPRKAG